MTPRHALYGWAVVLTLVLAACRQTPSPSEPTIDPVGNVVQTLELGGASSARFRIGSSEPGALEWHIGSPRYTDGTAWLTVSPSSGTTPSGQSSVVTLQVNRSGLEAGRHDATLPISSNHGDATLRVTVEVAGRTDGTARLSGRVTTANQGISLTAKGVNSGVNSAALEPLVTPGEPSQRPGTVPGQLLVRYHDRGVPSLQAAQSTLARSLDLTPLETTLGDSLQLYQLGDATELDAALAVLRRDPRVAYAEPNYYLATQALPNDPHLSKQWYSAAIGLPVGWGAQLSAKGVTVAVIDSGIDPDHEDLAARLVQGYDFCSTPNCTASDSDPHPGGSAASAHGTHVAGLVGAIGNNGRGTAGVAAGGVTLLSVKVFDDDGGLATVGAVAKALRWAAGLSVEDAPRNRTPAKVINLSLGMKEYSQTLADAVRDAQRAGALIVAAAGNNGQEGVLYPAAYDGVVSVGSVGRSLTRSCFSNYGSTLSLVAPGGEAPKGSCNRGSEGLLSTLPGNRYGGMAGTSMAAPLVSGVAALVWAQDPTLSASQVKQRLLESAYRDSSMSSRDVGRGLLRADRALGLPGPGDRVTVTASGHGSPGTATLDLYGSSSPFTLDLPAGDYRVSASSSGTRSTLTGETNLTLKDNDQKRVVLELAP